MRNNFKQSVIDAIAETQDGHLKSLRDDDHFSNFILGRIDHNSSNDELPHVDIESLITDFEYMISQLKAALRPLKQFEKDHPEIEIDPNTVYHRLSDEDMKSLMSN